MVSLCEVRPEAVEGQAVRLVAEGSLASLRDLSNKTDLDEVFLKLVQVAEASPPQA